MAADMRSPNVSVTPINMEPPPPSPYAHSSPPTTTNSLETKCVNNGGGGSLLITSSSPSNNEILDSSDAEVAQIDFQCGGGNSAIAASAAVNLRHKKKRDGLSGSNSNLDMNGATSDIPRPMSWEGELSDHERDMCIDDDDDLNGHHHHLQHFNNIMPENLSISSSSQQQQQQQQHQQKNNLLDSKDSPLMRLKQQQGNNYSLHSTPSNSPLLSQRHSVVNTTLLSSTTTSIIHKDLMHKALNVPPTPSPDSAIHSAYSVFSSPNQSPLTQRHITLTPNLSRNNSDASHSSCCSYSSVSVSVSPTQQFSPTHSPIQGRHMQNNLHNNSPLHHHTTNVLYRSLQEDHDTNLLLDDADDKSNLIHNNGGGTGSTSSLPAQPGISRQQLINSPCPICGDKISGFHYGIFSCESCKGFFKRTVQNRKNYVCLRGAACPVTVATRKKCPACRFDKCLQCGMKLEAIREDRTRGGRSTYQCSYSLPPSLSATHAEMRASSGDLRQVMSGQEMGMMQQQQQHLGGGSLNVKLEPTDGHGHHHNNHHHHHHHHHHHKRMQNSLSAPGSKGVPALLQEIMDVEHLWHYNEMELNRLNSTSEDVVVNNSGSSSGNSTVPNLSNHPLLAGTALAGSTDTNPDFVANLCNIADRRLYKIVKWCKSLPLFKNISIDDQICLLINSWCELLLFSCCFRSMQTPGEIRVSLGKSITLNQARDMGMQACIERMLNFTEQLRRLRVDQYEYVAMKVIVLLTSDTSELREAEKVRASQEKALKALQDYTISHYPDSPAKFGELLLRIPELQRTCQVGKEMLTIKSKDGDGPSFNLLMELLRGDH